MWRMRYHREKEIPKKRLPQSGFENVSDKVSMGVSEMFLSAPSARELAGNILRNKRPVQCSDDAD